MGQSVAGGCGEGDGAWHEADEVVHFREDGRVQAGGAFGEDGEVGVEGVGEEVFADAGEGVGPHGVIDGLLEGGLEILLY